MERVKRSRGCLLPAPVPYLLASITVAAILLTPLGVPEELLAGTEESPIALPRDSTSGERAPRDTKGADEERPRFRRGDVDGNGRLELSDPIDNLLVQFLGTFDPPCLDALDWDDNGLIEITDPIGNLTYQFLGTPRLDPPIVFGCESDRTPDELDCEDPPEDC